MDFIEIFTIPFMQRAIIAAILLAIILGFFGIFIVPRRLAFMADGITHSSLLGIALGLLIGSYPLIYAMILAIILGIILARITDYGRITQDGLVGTFLVGGMSAAIIIMSFIPGYKPELFSYLFGNLLSITWLDIYLLGIFFIIVILLLIFQWRTLVLTTMHNDLSRILDMPINKTRYFLFIGTSITLIAGVKLLGIILVSGLLIIPVLIANQVGNSFKSNVILTQLIAIIITFLGVLFSYVFDLPTGPSIGLLLVVTFILSLLYAFIRTKNRSY